MRRTALALAPTLLLAFVVALFAWKAPAFLAASNLSNILVQASSAAIVASGVTFVLLAGGIDLSVGSVMFLGAALCGKIIEAGYPPIAGAAAMLAVGPACGLAHGLLIARGGMSPFVVTMASLFILRGAGLWVGRTRAMNLPESFTRIASGSTLGVPRPVLLAGLAVLGLQLVLSRTAFGRRILAVGYSAPEARKAGLDVPRITTLAYVISGGCAALGGLAALAQLGAVSPTFGRDRELDAVAAAVLGGTSLFGGRGNVFPGAVVGSVAIAAVFNGLNVLDADPYIYQVITGAVVFLAVLLDGLRRRSTREGVAP